MSETASRAYGNKIFGQVIPSNHFQIFFWHIANCKNTCLRDLYQKCGFSPIFAVTVTLIDTSKTPSSSFCAVLPSSTFTCGAVRSVKICGAFGTSIEASFTYNFSIPKPGCAFSCCAASFEAACIIFCHVIFPKLFDVLINIKCAF